MFAETNATFPVIAFPNSIVSNLPRPICATISLARIALRCVASEAMNDERWSSPTCHPERERGTWGSGGTQSALLMDAIQGVPSNRSHPLVANRFELRDDLEVLWPSGSALGDDQRLDVDAEVDRPEKRHIDGMFAEGGETPDSGDLA